MIHSFWIKCGIIHMNIYQLIQNIARRGKIPTFFPAVSQSKLCLKSCISWFCVYKNRIRVSFFPLLGERKSQTVKGLRCVHSLLISLTLIFKCDFENYYSS